MRAELAPEGIPREETQETLKASPLSSLVDQAGLTDGTSRHLPSLAECAAEGKATRFQVVS